LIASVFSFSGSFANISYIDITGKSIKKETRKSFLSLKQLISASGLFVSAILAKNILTSFNVPLNYTVLFVLATIFLATASIGFWRIKEIKSNPKHIPSFLKFLKVMKQEIKQNKKLQNIFIKVLKK